jgi:hypothetical protein
MVTPWFLIFLVVWCRHYDFIPNLESYIGLRPNNLFLDNIPLYIAISWVKPTNKYLNEPHVFQG